MTLQDLVDRLRSRPHVPLLAGEPWDADLARLLRHASPEALFSGEVLRDRRMAVCTLAGLHLWNDDFDGCHTLCQAVETPTGSYWHGVAHRREGHRGEGIASNLGNARYWFRRAADHPAFSEVYESTLRVLDAAGDGFRWAGEAAAMLRTRGAWDPGALVDWVGQAEDRSLSPATAGLLEEIQWREMALLVDWCAREAVE